MADWETESCLQPRKVYIQEAAVVRQHGFVNKLELSSYNNEQCQTEEGQSSNYARKQEPSTCYPRRTSDYERADNANKTNGGGLFAKSLRYGQPRPGAEATEQVC
jgi:hypothetical protein